MRSHFFSIVFLIAFFAFVSIANINGQTEKRLISTPKAFQTFFAKFKRATVNGDKKVVATMTSFPFRYGWDAGDEGTYDRAQFLANFDKIFGDARNLFRQKNPKFYIGDHSYGLTNEEDASHYRFEKRGSTYKLVAFVVEP